MFDLSEFRLPSPIQQLSLNELKDTNVNLFIKRDDLIHPIISGNKWRKLEHTLLDAQQQNKTHLVSFGGAYSNHLLALACAASRFGFETVGFVRGENVDNPMLFLCQQFGMNLVFTNRTDYKDKQKLFHEYTQNRPNTYFIDEGGAGILGKKGCQGILKEIEQQQNESKFDHLFLPTATQTTLNGLLQHQQKHPSNIEIVGINVLKYSDKQQQICSNTNLIHTYHFGGYAKTPTHLLQFAQNIATQTGIIFDPIYTAKCLYAVVDMAQKNHFRPNANILMLHTGGLFGVFGNQ